MRDPRYLQHGTIKMSEEEVVIIQGRSMQANVVFSELYDGKHKSARIVSMA